ncbi:hypothetical protein KUTeg_018647, partial [Tegillarca granosa]
MSAVLDKKQNQASIPFNADPKDKILLDCCLTATENRAGFYVHLTDGDVDERASSPCQNGDVDECASSPCQIGDVDEYVSSPCQNGDVDECASSPYVDECASSPYVDECATSPCQIGDVDEYVSSPCQNGDVDEFASSPCQNDDIDECTSSPCQNDDVDECARSPCQIGDVDECATSPCQIGDVDEYASSPCQNGDVDECASLPCQNGDVDECASLPCQNGDVNECASSPCQNGGVCVDQVNGFGCLCPVMYEGIQCESLSAQYTTKPPRMDPTSCYLCSDGTPFFCENSVTKSRCPDSSDQYCANIIINNADGSRYIDRRCANETYCKNHWIHDSKTRSDCTSYDSNIESKPPNGKTYDHFGAIWVDLEPKHPEVLVQLNTQ